MNFSWANDLDPKGTNNQIKEAIDKRYVRTPTAAGNRTASADGWYPYSPVRLFHHLAKYPLVADEGIAYDDVAGLSSNNSSIMEADEAQLQASESDDSL